MAKTDNEDVIVMDGDTEFFENLERETFREKFGEDGDRFYEEGLDEVDITTDQPTDEELDEELSEILGDDYTQFDDEPELTDEEVKEKYGVE